MNSEEHWNINQYKKYINNKKGNNKYRATKTSIDGKKFDSIKEAEFYQNLKLRLRSGGIKGFCLQPVFILADKLQYRADFIVFNNDNTYEIIDVKGYKTEGYKIKKKIFEDKYNLKIKEV